MNSRSCAVPEVCNRLIVLLSVRTALSLIQLRLHV
jgi:hypothetical protein